MAEQNDHLDFGQASAPEAPGMEMEVDQRSHAMGYHPSPPQYLNIDEARETLSRKISARPTREELMKMNILKEYHSAPLLHAKQRDLQRARVEDTLQRRIPNRPSREALHAQNILRTINVGPVIQSSREALARASLTERLNENIAQRPGIMDLVLDQIIQTDPTLFELIASEAADGSEMPTPMPEPEPQPEPEPEPELSLPPFDLMDPMPLLPPASDASAAPRAPTPPPPPLIPPSAWNIDVLTLPTTSTTSTASTFTLPHHEPQELPLAPIPMLPMPTHAPAVFSSPAHSLRPTLPVTPTPPPTQDPLVRRPSESKIKRFRYHEYKYPTEKPKRPSSQPRRRPAKPGKSTPQGAPTDPMMLPGGAGYQTAVQQQARYLYLLQQAQEAPMLPNFGPEDFGFSHTAQSPLHDLLMNSISPAGTSAAPMMHGDPYRPVSATQANAMHSHPSGVVPLHTSLHASLQVPRTHGHSRASSWGGGFGKAETLPMSLSFHQSTPSASPMPHPPRNTPPMARAQSLYTMQPMSSPLAGPGARPLSSHVSVSMCDSMSSLYPISSMSAVTSLPLPPLSIATTLDSHPHPLPLPPLSISTTMASHAPPHELSGTSFGSPHFRFDDSFTHPDTLPDFDFSAPVILPDLNLV